MKNWNWKKIAVFAVLAAIVFVNNGNVSLWDQDEAAYAGFAKHMIETHEYSVPSFTWSEVHRKPPLHFWLISLSYRIFGVNEFAVRFFVALAVFLVYLMIYFFGKKFIGEKAAFYSAIVLGSSFFVPLLGKLAVTDGLLLFFHTLAGFALLYVLTERSWKWVAIFWIAVAGGLLVKGPPILIFTGFMIIILFAFHPQRKNLLILHPWFFGWLALAPLVIWGYIAWQQDNGQFIKWLIDWYVLKRVDSAVFGQTGPVGYYLVTIVLFFASYFVFFPSAFKNSVKEFWSKEKSAWFLLAAWFVAGWFFYEFLKSKLPAYVIAAYPGFAMAIGYQMFVAEKNDKDLKLMKYSAVFHLIITLSIVTGLVLVSKKYFDAAGYGQAFSIAMVYLMGTILGLVYIWTGQTEKANKTLLFNGTLFLILVVLALLPKADALRDATKQTALYIQQKAGSTGVIVVQQDFGHPPSLPFYLETKVKSDTIIYDNNFETADSIYNSVNNCVLILSPSAASRFEKKYPAVYVKHIESMAVDRKGNLEYYIVIKKQ